MYIFRVEENILGITGIFDTTTKLNRRTEANFRNISAQKHLLSFK